MTPEVVAERLEAVRRRISELGVDPAGIEIVAVTKGFGPDVVAHARAAGLQHLGENYADELLSKAALQRDACWHFLGPLQRNKASRLAPVVSMWEAVDRVVAAEAIAQRAPKAAVLIQVNVTDGAGRVGCRPEDTEALAAAAAGCGLDVRGLMAVAPSGDRQGARVCFKALAGLARSLGLAGLSMGMSDDFDIAVAEGATTIRLGRALFGPRSTPSAPQR